MTDHIRDPFAKTYSFFEVFLHRAFMMLRLKYYPMFDEDGYCIVQMANGTIFKTSFRIRDRYEIEIVTAKDGHTFEGPSEELETKAMAQVARGILQEIRENEDIQPTY